MRIGLMIGPERGRYRTKVERLAGRRPLGRGGRTGHGVDPADPRRVRRPDRRHRGRRGDRPHRDRHGGGAGPAPAPDRPGPADPVGAGRLRGAAGRRPRRLPPLGHRRDARAALRAPGGRPCGPTSTCSTRPWPGPGPVDVENELFRVHNPLDITDVTPTPVLLAALGPRMLQLCGERTDGTILWMADERAIGTYVVPNLTRAAEAAGRPAPRVVAGVPVCLCGDDEIDAAVARTNRILAEAEVSPNYQRLLEHGDARSVGDILVAGSESTIRKRLPVLRRCRRDRPLGAGWCRSGRAATSSSPRPSAPASCWPPWPRRSDSPGWPLPSRRVGQRGAGAGAGGWPAAGGPAPGSGPGRCRTAGRARGPAGRSGGGRARW